MKPIHLRLKAFGPFADEAEVSFDRVFDGGLFLIHGRTGAGKTSLLDGLCFSLFGRPSSEEREKEIRGLRSDLAQAATMTETELIFTIGSQVFRVHRIPTQPTPKKRGEGFTEYKGSAELFQLDGSLSEVREILAATARGATSDFAKLQWRPLAGKVEAVDEAIENLLGMNERQFRQVVVLPQGKFREFLSSTSSDRQVILEKLFQTDRFSRLQQFVSGRARSTETLYRQATHDLQAKLETLNLATVDDIEPRKKEVFEKSETASRELSDARARSEQLGQELNRAKELERSQIRLRDLERESAVLDARRPEIDRLKKRATIGRLWLPYFQRLDQAVQLEKKLAARETTKSEHQRSLAEKTVNRSTDAKRLALLMDKKPSLAEIANELVRLRGIAVLLKDVEKSTAVLSAEESKNKRNAAQISKLEAEHKALAESRISHALYLVRGDESLRAREATALETEDLRIKALELRYHHSEASRLAELLTPGSPCPVCGSSEHPAPAKSNQGDESAVTEASLQAEKSKFERLKNDFTSARARRQSRLESIEPLVATLKVAAVETPSNVDFEKQFDLFQTASRSFESVAQSIELTRTELQTREENIRSTREAIDSKRKSLAATEQSYDEVVKRGVELKAEQDSREPEMRNLERQIALHDGEIARLTGAMQALDEEITVLRTDLAAANSERDHVRLGIEMKIRNRYPDEAESPVRAGENELRADDLEIENYTAQAIKISSALSEVQKTVQQHAGTRAIEIIQSEFEAASNLRTELERSAARLLIELEALSKLEKETASELERLNRLKSEAERGARLSQLLSGDRAQNKLLVPLSRFVLQSRFEEVLEQANRRLGRMSRGQFQLRRPALSRNLRDSQGLEIRVEDAIAGTERHAGSLSGGESFMAALSLALGLADVVQADLGGVKLDSVLIDEGFGTLDSESLDLAMKTLIDLQAGGRIVGIISHVQEIKNQIPHRLEVKKHADGSEVLWNDSN